MIRCPRIGTLAVQSGRHCSLCGEVFYTAEAFYKHRGEHILAARAGGSDDGSESASEATGDDALTRRSPSP